MVKEDLKAKLRTKRKQAKQVKPLPPKQSTRAKATGPNLFTLIYTRKWDKCFEVTATHPHQSETKDRMGDLPLHEACNSGAPFQLIQAIHRSYPTAISHRGFCGRLPLHYASYNKPSLHVIQYLIRQFPESVQQFDDDGRLPLHLAVVRNAPKQAIQALIAAYPKSLTIPNQFGNTPEMLARNDIVHDLLLAEKAKPRRIDQKLTIEKKLMRDWTGLNMGSKKESPSAPQELGHSPNHSMGSAITAKRGTLSKKQLAAAAAAATTTTNTKKPLSHSDNANIPKNRPRKQGHAQTTKKSLSHLIQKATQTHLTKKSASTSMIPNDDSSRKSRSSRRTSRSLSSGRSTRTIKATHDDLIFLEDAATDNNPRYKESSRLTSPKSLFDYQQIIEKSRQSRSVKKEIMSTSSRRKVLPSPTRLWEYPAHNYSMQPEWKRRQYSRKVV